jgi:hypothetical protein
VAAYFPRNFFSAIIAYKYFRGFRVSHPNPAHASTCRLCLLRTLALPHR